MATELVAVNMCSGKVFRLGHEDSGGVMHFTPMTCMGSVFPDKKVAGDMEVQAFVNVHGSSTLLALAFQADDNYVWAVFEKDMSAVRGARARVLMSKRNDGPMEDIYQTPGVGVTVYDRLSHTITFPFNT
jgi:hypothetical protein